MKTDNNKTKPKKRFKIRTQIFLGFAIFVVIIVALQWIFQISLLGTFYRKIKELEVKKMSSEIIEILEDEDYISELELMCRQRGADVLIANEYGKVSTMVTNVRSDFFNLLDIKKISRIYSGVAGMGGESLEYLSADGIGGKRNKPEVESILYVKLCGLSDGTSRMIMINARCNPVDSTVSTLKVELWCLTGVMIILSALLAFIISRRIAVPIENMSISAAKLASGDLNAVFPQKGSMETAVLAETLESATEELRKTDDLRKELIANVSHDLRTPLTMIKGYSELMREIPGENTPENVQLVIDEAERLSNLVNDLLDISKLESGTLLIEKTDFSLTESIKAIIKRFSTLSEYSINFDYESDVIVCADELKISQVIYNLVGNAITHAGESKQINIYQTVEAGKVRISVSDTGEGIPQENLADIWERYYKVDKAHKRSRQGTGLGLSIVKKILDLHGGTYGVVSTIGVGSTFWFELDVK